MMRVLASVAADCRCPSPSRACRPRSASPATLAPDCLHLSRPMADSSVRACRAEGDQKRVLGDSGFGTSEPRKQTYRAARARLIALLLMFSPGARQMTSQAAATLFSADRAYNQILKASCRRPGLTDRFDSSRPSAVFPESPPPSTSQLPSRKKRFISAKLRHLHLRLRCVMETKVDHPRITLLRRS